MRRTAKAWSYHAGEKGRNRVRVFEHPRTGTLFLEVKDGGAKRRVALGHRDRGAAKAKADEVAGALAQHTYQPRSDLTLATLFDNYVREVTPTKGQHKQAHDRRATRMLLDILGPQRTAASLTIRDWQRFIAERRKRGDQRPGSTYGQPVGARQIEYDLRLLLAVLNWAVRAGWLDRNPLAGCPFPDGETPNRPIVTDEQYRRLLAVSGDVSPMFRLALIVTHETGHRIGAVSLLRWSDIYCNTGMVRWRGGQDKIKYEHVTPLTTTARTVLEQTQRERGAIGDAWVFPSPTNPERSISRHLLRDWWQRGEQLAQLDPEPRRGWHSLRRKFATELKATPLVDLCALGGWKEPQTVLKCYQRPDAATMRAALDRRQRLA